MSSETACELPDKIAQDMDAEHPYSECVAKLREVLDLLEEEDEGVAVGALWLMLKAALGLVVSSRCASE